MRLSFIFIFAALMQVSASSLAQKITLSERQATLEIILQKIRLQTGYDFLYDVQAIKAAKPIDINVRNSSLEDALNSCLTGQDFSFTIDDKSVIIRRKPPTFLERLAERWASIDISGRVVDADGRGLPGASVSVKGKGGKAVSTGANGNFYLKGVDEDAMLVISFIGYVSKEVKAAKELGDVVLELSNSKLDEVQVIAYGTTTQRLSTGNVTTIKADVIEKQPVNNPLLALQGRVPGLFIEQATGFAGTGLKVRIQGINSIGNGNDPLYVIDGIPYTSQLMEGGNSVLGRDDKTVSYGNPFNFINPADIASIDVLKDADATAIYGSRAANGAILITTKKGQAGDIKVSANIQNGWGTVSRRMDLMDSEQYLEMRRAAFRSDGINFNVPPYNSDAYKTQFYPDLSGFWDITRSTDWQNELIGGTAQFTDINSSVSGGSNNLTFLVGAGYHKEGNVFPGDFDDVKGSLHFNVNGNSANQKFKFQFSGSYLQDNNLLPGVDLTTYAMTLAPVAPSLLNPDGRINWQPDASGGSTFKINPLGYLLEKHKNKTNNLVANAIVSYQILPGLNIKSSFGYNDILTKIIYTRPATRPEYIKGGFRNTTFNDANIDTWIAEPQLTYNLALGKGKIEALLGGTFQEAERTASTINASGFSSDQVMEDIKSATTIAVSNSVNSMYKYNALFGRLNYNWQNRYIINLNMRRDGSSRFGSENRFHNFASVGAAWIFSEEDFIKNNLRFLSYGKLRASYGTTGNDQVGDYSFLSLYNSIDGITMPYQGYAGYQPAGLTNPYLQWEETRKLQLGLDLGFLDDRILANVNYSRNRSSNQLIFYNLPGITGFTGILANLPATLQNTGWEFVLSTNNLTAGDFKWSTSINLTLPKNKLIAYPDLENSSYANYYVIGESINMKRKFHFLGVNSENGLYEFAGKNGDPTTSPLPDYLPENDAIVQINPDPKFYGGLQNTISFKGFTLDVLFQFTKQVGENYLVSNLASPGYIAGGASNQPVWQSNGWQNPGDDTQVAKYSSNSFNQSYFNLLASDAKWSDASYVRLKNLSLSWNLPSNWINRAHLRDCKLYLQGQNLFTVTNYMGLDPETKSTTTLPPLRVITIGIKLGL